MREYKKYVNTTKWSVIKTCIQLCSGSPNEIIKAHLPLSRLVEYPVSVNLSNSRLQDAILEIGAGRSILPIHMARLGLHVCAVDIDEDNINFQKNRKTLRNERGVHFENIDVRQLESTERYNCVICISVIEHIPKDGDSIAIQKMAGCLLPGGRLVVSIPFGIVYREISAEYCNMSLGCRVYNQSAIKSRLAAPSGLEEEELVYFGWKSIYAMRIWRCLCSLLSHRFIHHAIGWASLLVPGSLYGIIKNLRHGLPEGAILVFRKPKFNK